MLRKLAVFVCFGLFAGVTSQDSCPALPLLGSPVNIFNIYFQNFFRMMSDKNNDSSISLLYYNASDVEDLTTFRFVWRVSYTYSKLNYIGILATGKKTDKGELAYEIIRFIQTSDIKDAKKLLGLYNISEVNVVMCGGMKYRFSTFFEDNPYTPTLPEATACKDASVPIPAIQVNSTQPIFSQDNSGTNQADSIKSNAQVTINSNAPKPNPYVVFQPAPKPAEVNAPVATAPSTTASTATNKRSVFNLPASSYPEVESATLPNSQNGSASKTGATIPPNFPVPLDIQSSFRKLDFKNLNDVNYALSLTKTPIPASQAFSSDPFFTYDRFPYLTSLIKLN